MVVDIRLVRLDLDAGAAVPDLRSLLAVPPEGEHVLTRAEVGRDLQLVHDGEEESRNSKRKNTCSKTIKTYGMKC